MTKLCTLALTLFLAVPCLAQAALPTAVTPQQVDDIVDHLIRSLADYVFPDVAEKLQSQIRTHRSEYHFSVFIPDSQPRSPITNSNWQGTGVEPDVATTAPDALFAAYKLALKNAKPSLESEALAKERQLALQDPQAALSEEIAGFQKN